MFGEKIAHGTPFRRAVEEGLLEGKRVVQIGLRGTGYTALVGSKLLYEMLCVLPKVQYRS